MFNIRQEQLNALRKQSLGDGLIKSFKDSGQSPSREPRTGDVLVKDPRSNTTRFSFDRQGFIGNVKSPLGRTWRLENDQQGRLLGLTNPAGLRLGVEYNAQGDVRSVSRSQRTLFNLNYDKPGRFSQIVYPDQTAAQFQYDTSNLLSAFTSRLNITETYEHNPDGDLVSITDGNNNRTAFEYSVWNRPDHVRYADGSTESYEYDLIGLVRRITVGSEAIAELEHNDAGQPTKISYSDGDIVSFRYDDNNRVIEARNAEITVQCEYDDEGRVIREKQGEQLIEYHYDDSGTLTGLSYPSGEKVEFSYDEDLRLASVADWDKGLHKFSYIENDGGFILRSPNGLATTVHQSAEGLTRATVVARETSGGQLFSLEYQYDVEDRLTTLRDSEFGTRQYAYDAEGQLLSVSATQAARGEVFAYDRAGNRVRRGSERATFNAINQLKSQGDIQCSYDVRGNQVSCLSPNEAWQYTYNSRNLLIRAEGRNGQVISFGYDAFGRRLWKRSGEIRVSYIWAGEHLVREVKEDGSRSSAQDYLYYPGTYTPLSTRVDGKVYYYHTDHLGAPRRLTDPYGNTVWSADYDAFGEARVKTHLIENPLRFPGQYFDQETGLHYNRFRYYSPILGRYLSRDPVTYLSGLNFYAYAGNNPVNSADPLGLWSWKTVVSVVAAVAVGIAVVAFAPIALPLAIVAAGAAAGAVGAGLNEALNQEKFCLPCIAKAALKGAFVGAIAALPFVFLPATAGVAAYTAVGGLSGGLGYAADQFANYPDAKWSWKDFGIAVGIGAATAGVGRYLGGKYSQWKEGRASTGTPRQRPSWRQSEIDAGKRLQGQGFEPQKSFKNGQEVPYGTKGSTRPEYYKPGRSVEVKNYNVETSQGRNNLIRNVTNQAKSRAANLPPGTKQEVILDTRGQNVPRAELKQLIQDIVGKSNGALKPGDITILR